MTSRGLGVLLQDVALVATALTRKLDSKVRWREQKPKVQLTTMFTVEISWMDLFDDKRLIDCIDLKVFSGEAIWKHLRNQWLGR